jgi:Rrf2 family iron-sulfur cluster assembly transcriptional regulator
MIYSRSAAYAIRASLHLGLLEDGKCAMAREIAAQEEIPAHFLAKLLQILARKGLLKSQKGPTGGFCLRMGAKDVRLIDIVDAVDGLNHYDKCIVGFPQCNDKMGCPMHNSWVALHSRIMDYLKRNTIGSLVRQMETRNSAGLKPAGGKKQMPRRQMLRVVQPALESKKAKRPSL